MKSAQLVIKILLAFPLIGQASFLGAQEANNTSAEITSINELLTDTATGHVSAASLLGISADATTAVENTRTALAAIAGLGTSDEQVALAFTPARSSFFPMSLSTYSRSFGYRLLGNTTFSFAQGTSDIETVEMERMTYSIETSTTLDRDDDPLIAVQNACKWDPPVTIPGQPADFTSANSTYLACIRAKEAALAEKWNISRFSASFATGTIEPKGASSTSLGRTVAASIIYGFDRVGIKALEDGAAVTLTYKYSRDEPVLAELAKGNIARKNSSLAAVRFSFGTGKLRGLVEVSDATETGITASQSVFKRALGIDLRISEGLWLSVRNGVRNLVSGTGEENATFLNFSFSPKSDLL